MDEGHQHQAESKRMATKRKRILVRTRQKMSTKRKWTGFSGKMLWDWMQLLIIPFVLAVGGFWFTAQQNQTSLQIGQQQHQTDLQIARDQQQEITLKTYLDDISDLLLNHSLASSKPGDEVREVARVRTLTVLRRLGADRNKIVLQFLQDAHLIGPTNKTVIDFSYADLSKNDLGGANLLGVNLSNTNLDHANLSRANFSEILGDPKPHPADLTAAQLMEANLNGAELTAVVLSGVTLNGANLSEAHLGYADLDNADLGGASFRGADLIGADLSGVRNFTQQQLDQVFNCQYANLPKGLTCHHNMGHD